MQLEHIQTSEIRPPKFLLRPVRETSVEFLEMKDSIRDNGLWQPILVRPLNGGVYEVVEGNWRYTCCKQLRFRTIPCVIRTLTDEEVLLAQLQSNGIRPETSPVEFSERLAQLMQRYPDMTAPKMARMIRKSPTWIHNILRLRHLNSKAAKMLKRGEISLEAACALARLPPQVQSSLVQQAKTMPSKDFVKIARSELKHYREAALKGYIENRPSECWKPVPYLQSFAGIKREYNQPQVAGSVLTRTKAKTPFDGWMACLAWILHLDPESLEVQERLIEQRRDQQRRAEERRKRERQELRELRKQTGDNNIITLELEDLEHE